MIELWSVKPFVCFYYQSYCHLQSSTGQTILCDLALTKVSGVFHSPYLKEPNQLDAKGTSISKVVIIVRHLHLHNTPSFQHTFYISYITELRKAASTRSVLAEHL